MVEFKPVSEGDEVLVEEPLSCKQETDFVFLYNIRLLNSFCDQISNMAFAANTFLTFSLALSLYTT